MARRSSKFAYQLRYGSHRRHIDLDLFKKTYVVDTLNVSKPWVGTQLPKGCRPLGPNIFVFCLSTKHGKLICSKRYLNQVKIDVIWIGYPPSIFLLRNNLSKIRQDVAWMRYELCDAFFCLLNVKVSVYVMKVPWARFGTSQN